MSRFFCVVTETNERSDVHTEVLHRDCTEPDAAKEILLEEFTLLEEIEPRDANDLAGFRNTITDEKWFLRFQPSQPIAG